MFAPLARSLAGIVLSLSLAAVPAHSQYMFLDANGDGVNTSADVLDPVGTTTLDVWLHTNANRDGSPAVCATGEEMTINTYEFILKSTNGQMNWLAYTNHMTESTLSFGLASNATEYHNGFGGGPILPPGTYRLGTLSVSVALGTPSLSFGVTTAVNGAWLTSFGSQCPGVDFDNTMKLGTEWFDADGVAYGGAPQSPPVLSPIADMTANEGEVAEQTITATDPDQQPLLFQKVSGPLFMSVATPVPGNGTATGVITLAPGPLDHGASTATVRVTDGSASDERSFNITIVDTSPHNPVIYTEPAVSIGVGQTRQVGVLVTDPDHDPLTLSLAGRPSFVPNFLYGPSEGVGGIGSAYFIAPASGDVGRSFVVLEATDGTEVAYARVEINVSGAAPPAPPPPDLFGAGYTVQEIGGPPTSIGMGDLDGDGDADAAIASTAAGFIEIYASDGRGGLDLVERIQAPRAGAMAVGDFDRDGVDDVACAELGTADIVVYRGPFTGAATLSQRIHVGGGLTALAIADVDRKDGVDLLAVKRDSARLVRFLNDGAGTFGAAIEDATSPNPVILTTADFDADGWLDVAVFCQSPGVFDLFTNRGDGGFLAPVTQPIDGINNQDTITPLSAVAYDDDRDGDLDIGVATGRWIVILGRGSNGQFYNGLYRFGGMTTVTTADLHATGHGDLLAGSGMSPDGNFGTTERNYVAVLSPYGQTTQSIPQPGGRIAGIASGDVDRDGRPDVITVQNWSKTGIAAVYRTQPDGQLGAAKVINAASLYGSPVLGDFNNDGHIDIVGGGTTMLGAGDGTFPTILHPNTYFGLDAETRAADLNGDGLLDIISVPSCCNHIYPRLGDGTGNFVAPPVSSIFSSHEQGRGFALADFDEDGAVDFVVSAGAWRGEESELKWEVWRGVGDGTFHPPALIPVGLATSKLNIVDFDSDGHLDITFTRGPLWGVRGHGDATFGTPEVLVPSLGGTWGLGWGDLNGDGRADVTFNKSANTVPMSVSLQLSDRTFATPRLTWTQGQGSYANPWDVHVFDVNGDGRSDIVTPYSFGLAVGLGDGSGSVSRRRVFGPVGGTVMIGDVDEDGWSDIVSGGASGYNLHHPIVIFRNNSDLVNRRAARAFLSGGDKTIPIGATGRNLCVRVEPVDGSYQNSELDPASIVMKSMGTGSVNQITAVPGKRAVLGDTDGNGVEEFDACFEAEKLEQLFSAVQGRRTLPVVLEGRVLGGGRMHAEFSLTVVRAGAPAAPSLSPNPLNPTGVFRFATTRPGTARIRLFDVQGRLVRTIVDRPVPAGEQEVFFDGKDRAGRSLASGIYYARIETADGEFRHRVAVIK